MKTSHHPLFTRADTPACPNCGFSLQGLGAQGACPECGTAYDADNAYPLVPPTTLRALWYAAKPTALGSVPAIGAIFALAATPVGTSEVAMILTALALAAVAAGFVSWTAWRGALLIDAIMASKPRLQEERPAMRALGCGAAGMLGLVGVLSLGVMVMLLVAFGTCVVGSAP